MDARAKVWWAALERYRYPVDFSLYSGRSAHAGWFCRQLEKGDRAQIRSFERYFREHALTALEPWYEVVYWRMFRHPQLRNRVTAGIIERLRRRRTLPSQLWYACAAFVESPTADVFAEAADLLGCSRSIALAATFPAFLSPEGFPLIDRHVADWVMRIRDAPSWRDCDCRPLAPAAPWRAKASGLTLSDWTFMEAWILWCRSAAVHLTIASHFHWRARDVEMAVCNAERTGMVLPPPFGYVQAGAKATSEDS